MAKDEKKTKKKDESKDKSQKSGGGVNKLLVIIIALLVLIIIGGAGAFFLLFQAPSDEEIAKELEKEKEPPQEVVAPTDEEKIGVIVELKPFIVNLEDPKARHFLKATISLEVKDDAAKDQVEKFKPKIRNDILLLLSSKTLDDVITIEGKVRLKDEIMSRVGRILGPGKLKNVYFSQFVVQ